MNWRPQGMVEITALCDATDVLNEIIVTREIGGVCEGFAMKLLKACVVKGRYPTLLMELWDEYNNKKGSENVRPGELYFV